MQYADRRGFDAEMNNIFLPIIQSLDAAWIEYQNKNSK